MSLYKRDNTWWIDFTTAAGARIRRSTDTGNKLEAQQLHDQLKAASWRVERLGERRQHTWDEAARKWIQETRVEDRFPASATNTSQRPREADAKRGYGTP